MKKNERISLALKKYHKKKRIKKQQRKEIKTILWLMAFVALISLSQTFEVFASEKIEEPRMVWSFPETATTTPTVYQKRQLVANQIRHIGKQRGFKWLDYAVNMACCESYLGSVMENKNGNIPSHSVDRGYYMFNDYWQSKVSDECAYDLECSTNLFMDKVDKGYQALWVCDKHVKGVKDYSLKKCGVK